LLRTRETEEMATPAANATSRMVLRPGHALSVGSSVGSSVDQGGGLLGLFGGLVGMAMLLARLLSPSPHMASIFG
jgi:hypothetical protein